MLCILHLLFKSVFRYKIRKSAAEKKGFDRQDDDAGQMDQSFPGADCRYSIKGNSGEEKI